MIIEFDAKKIQIKDIDVAINDLEEERKKYETWETETIDEDAKIIDSCNECIKQAIGVFNKAIHLSRRNEIINKDAKLEKLCKNLENMSLSEQRDKINAFIESKIGISETDNKLSKLSKYERKIYHECMNIVTGCMDEKEKTAISHKKFLELMFDEHQETVENIEEFILENIKIVKIGGLQIGIPNSCKEEIRKARKIKIGTDMKHKNSDGHIEKKKELEDTNPLKIFASSVEKKGLKIYLISERDPNLCGYGTLEIEPFNCK